MSILLKPVITEKMTDLGETLNQYAFIVDRKANKIQIKNAVQEAYGVTVRSVNTMVLAGKEKMRYTKTGVQKGATKSCKKGHRYAAGWRYN
jgi:large subunit ribosomal protein L23